MIIWPVYRVAIPFWLCKPEVAHYMDDLALEVMDGAQVEEAEVEGDVDFLERPFFPFLLAIEMKYY